MPDPVKLLILDRDGVINQDSDDFIKSPDEWVPVPGSLKAISRLNRAGYRVAVASNQSGVARGLFDLDMLHAINAKMLRLIEGVGGRIDLVVYCPHGPEEGCDCRKPKSGLYLDIARHFKVGLQGVPVIGDSLRDLEAARAVSALPILVRSGKGMRTLAAGEGLDGVAVYDDLLDAVSALIMP